MKKRFLLIAVFCLLGFSGFYAAEYKEGRIRLDLHEDIGRFSLYYLADAGVESYLPFFIAKDPRSSFLSFMSDNQSYRMGEDTAFSVRLGGTSSNPALVFESSFAAVTEEFTFIRTSSSSVANGVRITITVANKTGQPVNAGIRFLIDTSLGENETVHFISDKRQINSETQIDFSSDDNYWVSGNKNLTLMGSISTSGSTRPSFVRFANWKRFNDAKWEFSYVKGRDFNLLPYSIGDSAVCYYFEPELIPAEGNRTVTIMLAAKDERGFSSSNIAVTGNSANPLRDMSPVVRAEESTTGNQRENEMKQSMQADLYILQDLINRLQDYSISRALTDDELTRMRLLISRIKGKYNIP